VGKQRAKYRKKKNRDKGVTEPQAKKGKETRIKPKYKIKKYVKKKIFKKKFGERKRFALDSQRNGIVYKI